MPLFAGPLGGGFASFGKFQLSKNRAPPANVYWLKIAVQIDREPEFWEEMERQLTR